MAIEVFNRYEYKYILNKQQFKTILNILNEHENLLIDDYCQINDTYKIRNIYVDTDNYQLIRDSIAKPIYKHKLRIRTYTDTYNDDDFIFFEIKKKYRGLVNKRRCKMKFKEAREMIETNKMPSYKPYMNSQILKEIHYIISNNQYKLTSVIAYDRVAYFSRDRKLRISFDTNICSNTHTLLENDCSLMEIKTPDAIPIWLVEILNQHNIKRQSYSKYGRDFIYNLEERLI